MSPLSGEDAQSLLALARRSIEHAVSGRALGEFGSLSGALLEKAGAFVTLRNQGSLRGCIGQVEARDSLATTVAECAAAAALNDPRFLPVDSSELKDLAIEINVLSPTFDIRPEEIEIGRHGLLISTPFTRGLLLPEVAVEWDWDAEGFLDETCRKAGLAPGAWRRNARIQAFTTQAFAEPGFHVPEGGGEVDSPEAH